MGNDGGALSNKRSVLQAVLAQRAGANDDGGASAAAESGMRDREAKCQTCALSSRPLSVPVAGDAHGNLMLRAAVAEMLLARKAAGDDASAASMSPLLSAPAAAGIRKMKNVVTLAIPDTPDAEGGGASGKSHQLELICPLTGLALSRGAVAFGFFFGCGHFFSDAGLAATKNNRGDGGAGGSSGSAVALPCPSCGIESPWVPVITAATGSSSDPPKSTTAIAAAASNSAKTSTADRAVAPPQPLKQHRRE
jgi:hypothetical protein